MICAFNVDIQGSMSLDALTKCLADLSPPETDADAAQSPSYRLGSAAVCGCSAYTCMHVHKEWQQPAHISDRVSDLMHNHVFVHSLDHACLRTAVWLVQIFVQANAADQPRQHVHQGHQTQCCSSWRLKTTKPRLAQRRG